MKLLILKIIRIIPVLFILILFSYLVFYSFRNINAARKGLKVRLAAFLRYSSLKPEFIKFIDLNFNTLFSDYFWVLFVQEASSFKLAKLHYPYMYKICLITVSLNPRFNYAYQAGGTLLGLSGKPQKAIKLLKIGMKHMEGNWNIPFLIAYNYFYNIGNFKKAAYYLKYAVDTKGSPKYLELLYMKLLNRSGNLQGALSFLDEMYKNNKNPEIRHFIQHKINAVKKEMMMKKLNKKFKTPYALKLFLPKEKIKRN